MLHDFLDADLLKLLVSAREISRGSDLDTLKRALREYIAHRLKGRPWQERFWAMVQKGEGCWEWQGARSLHGYGCFKGPGGKSLRASRVSWELSNGAIPKGLHVLHECDNPPCVRPDHLSVGTHQENMDDMASKGRSAGSLRGGNPKLSIQQVNEIRERGSGGESYVSIAKSFDITPQAVGQLLRGQTWVTS